MLVKRGIIGRTADMQELVIGRDRQLVSIARSQFAASQSKLPRMVVVLGLLMSASLAAAAVPATRPAPDAPFPIVFLSGTPEEIGTAHGRLLGKPLLLLREQFLLPWFKDPTTRAAAILAAAMYATFLEPAHRAELRALSRASGIDVRELMLAQCLPDLSPMFGCSTVALPASASPDNVARFGRNLDFPTLGIADKHSVLLVYRPAAGNRFVAVAWPGLIGVLSGMNEHGLAVANMEVPRKLKAPVAVPCSILYRTILERCSTVDEAIALLRSSKRQTENNLMLMDAAGNRAVVEIGTTDLVVRRAEADEPLFSTNHTRGENNQSTQRCWRYDYLKKSTGRQAGAISLKQLQTLLAGVQQEGMTMQSMIFEPATRVMHLAVGIDAASREMVRIDVDSLLRAEISD